MLTKQPFHLILWGGVKTWVICTVFLSAAYILIWGTVDPELTWWQLVFSIVFCVTVGWFRGRLSREKWEREHASD